MIKKLKKKKCKDSYQNSGTVNNVLRQKIR